MSSTSKHRRLAERVRRASMPRPDGLPGPFVLWVFPALVALAILLFTLLDLNGSSTGIFATMFGSGQDPNLLAGSPRPIRSDEWLAQGTWVVSQVAQGYPHINRVFPGGTDATLMNDLPTKDWSTLLRPHTWGFLLLGLDRGEAIRWWVPAGLMVATCYQFVVSLLPKMPWVGAGLALFVLFQPAVQWWWLPVVPNPVAFAFATMTAVVWGVRSSSRLGRWVPAALAGYLACDMAMGIYVPSMIPALLAVAAFTVGFLLRERAALGVRGLVRSLLPLLVAGALAAGVVAVWILTRRAAVADLLGTVYPGQRKVAPGAGGSLDALAFLSAPFQQTLQLGTDAHGIGPNQSEASSVLLVSLFLLVPLVVVTVLRWRRERTVDWLVVSLVAAQAVVLVWLYVPGWGPVAELLGLDRAVPQRLRIFFAIMAVVAVVTLLEQLVRLGVKLPWPVAAAAGLSVLALSAWPWLKLRELESAAASSVWSAVAVGLSVAGVVLLARGRAAVGVTALLAVALVLGAGVNPINRGVYDLRTTEAGRAVSRIAATHPHGRWVAVNTNVAMAILVETGVAAYSGVQTYPSARMWEEIDPDGSHEDNWNRLAHVYWVDGTGDPDPRQPPGAGDQIRLTFDSCADFAQEHVSFVLADQVALDQPCLRLLRKIRQGHARQWIYQVTPAQPT